MKVYANTGYYDSGPPQVALTKPDGRFGRYLDEIEVPGELKAGDWVYVVTVTYTTGNTFGREGGNKAFGALLTDADKAFELADLFQDHERKIRSSEWRKLPYDQRGVEEEYYVTFDGERYYVGPWTGYFESIDYVNVDRVAVGS